MKRLLAVLTFVFFAFAASPACAQGTLTLHYGRPELTVRTGAVQAVSARSDGWAPYLEAQVLTRLARTSFGLAAHGGLSYERHERPAGIVCFAAPCPDPDLRESYFDFVSGVRAGFFPERGPVDLFVGVASHAVRQSRRIEDFDDGSRTTWRWYPAAQAGVDVLLPLTRRLNLGVGAVGFVPLFTGEGARLEEVDTSRFGAHLNLRYGL